MRKTFFFTLLLALLAVGSIGYVACDIYPLRDQVAVGEVEDGLYSYGDASAAEGLVVTLKTDYYKAMNWQTKVYFGDDIVETKTDYVLKFPVQKTTNYLREREDIDIRITVEGVLDADDLAYLAEGLELGERREERVYLKEYADFYHVEADILFPEMTYAWRPSDTAADNETEAALKALFDENFLFPMGEYVSVDADGEVTQHGPACGYSINESSELFGLDVKQTFVGNSAYFTFNRDGDGYHNLDVSHLPLGYGVYCVTVPQDGGRPTLRNVCALDPETEILKLTSDDSGNILVYTVENGMVTVTAIDAKTNTVTQRLELAEFPVGTAVWATYEADEAIAVTLASEAENDRLVLLTMEGGLYKLHWDLSVPSAETRLLSCSDVSQREYRYDYVPVMAWNGQYLALGLSEEYRSGFDLALYDENGLAYYNKYKTSLNFWPIGPDADMPLTLEWE